MPLNINQGAAGNPLDALLAGRSLYGSANAPIAGLFQQALSGGGIDPRLYNYGFNIDTQMESPVYTIGNQRVDPTGDILVNGKPYVQLASTSIGGPGQAIDPSQVIYDPQFGLLTQQSNVKPISNGYGDAVFALGSLGMALPTAAVALAGSSGGLGSTAGIASTDAAESGGTLALNAAGTGVTPYVPSGLGAAGTAAGNYAPVSEGSTPLPGAGGAQVVDHGVNASGGLFGSSGGASGLLSQAGNWVMQNPLRAFGLAQTAYGLLNGGGGSSGGGGGSSKGGGGGSLTSGGGTQQQFYVNPYTYAQLQRSRGGQ
jgi:hypothetical protein